MPGKRKSNSGRTSRHARDQTKYRRKRTEDSEDSCTEHEITEEDSVEQRSDVPALSTNVSDQPSTSTQNLTLNPDIFSDENDSDGSTENDDGRIYVESLPDIPYAAIDPNLDSSATEDSDDENATDLQWDDDVDVATTAEEQRFMIEVPRSSYTEAGVSRFWQGSFQPPVAAYTCMKEDQKRGLLHVHILLILEKGSKLKNGEQVCKFVSAELPSPDNPELFNTVKKHMIHGPCGAHIDDRSPCMKNGKCTKGFPKDLVDSRTRFQEDSKAVLQRRSPAAKGHEFELHMANGTTFVVDNRWVVPYNSQLLLMFNAHINVEVVNSAKSVKYVYKYTCKGTDKAAFGFSASNTRNEVENFLNGRYIGTSEALYNLFMFDILKMWPPVRLLPFHLPDQQTVTFEPEPKMHHHWSRLVHRKPN